MPRRELHSAILAAHEGGKIAVRSRVALLSRADLAVAYTPGVAEAAREIAERPEAVRELTARGNTVAIVTDGSAVLGLGDVGPSAALPVMEGKAVLLRELAGVDAWPICVNVREPERIVEVVRALEPSFGGVLLEDISAPRCFEVESRLQATMGIPVFHDDQHGTAVVVLAGLLNAVRVVGRQLASLRVVVLGAGAAGSAVARLLLHVGVDQVLVCDRQGILAPGRAGMDGGKAELAMATNPAGRSGSLQNALDDANVFVGLSVPGAVGAGDLTRMASDPIVFALANPEPEVDLSAARRHASVVASGRSDDLNQINNVLAFPGLFRGLLDAGARSVTMAMQVAAAHAVADRVTPADLVRGHIVPDVFDEGLVPAVAAAVRRAL